MLTPSDRRTLVAAVKQTVARHMTAKGWELGPSVNHGLVVIRKRFGSNEELRQQLDIFAEYRIPAQVE